MNRKTRQISENTALILLMPIKSLIVQCWLNSIPDMNMGEERWVGIGLLSHLVVVVTYVERDKDEVIRIISLRKALNYERKLFEESI